MSDKKEVRIQKSDVGKSKSFSLSSDFRLLFSVLCLLTSVFCSGCIRLTGGAGYYTEKDGEVKSKQAGFDTANLNPNRPKGNITIGEET